MLQFDRGAHHAEVIAQVQRAGWLYAGKDAFHAKEGLEHNQRAQHRGNEVQCDCSVAAACQPPVVLDERPSLGIRTLADRLAMLQ
jgi:hypothetical protein